MVKVRRTTPEEEADMADLTEEVKEAVEAGESFPEGDATMLAEHIASGKTVVISDQVRAFLAAEGISEDEFIASLLKQGNRIG